MSSAVPAIRCKLTVAALTAAPDESTTMPATIATAELANKRVPAASTASAKAIERKDVEYIGGPPSRRRIKSAPFWRGLRQVFGLTGGQSLPTAFLLARLPVSPIVANSAYRAFVPV